MPLICFQKVSKIYPPQVFALKEVSFEVEKGEFLSVVGRSGAGKTTLLKLLLAEEKPSLGKIFFENKDLSQIVDLSKYRQKLGVIFQDYRLLSSKTVYENVAYVLEIMGYPDQEIQKNVSQVLQLVGLEKKADNFPRQLSGGEQQRAAIARALIHRPEVILADEPTGNLDPYHTREVISILEKINQMGTTIILATHNQEIISSLKKRAISLDRGKLIQDNKKGSFIL